MSTQIASFDLISIAQPTMEDAYQCVEYSDMVLLLLNGAGYILEMLGDRGMLDKLKNLGMERGSLLAEERIGTCAMGLVLIEQTPVQVVGAEHYCRELHDLAGVAAPIFDLTGRSLGALGLFTTVENYHPHSLGLVTAVAVLLRDRGNLIIYWRNKIVSLLNWLPSFPLLPMGLLFGMQTID